MYPILGIRSTSWRELTPRRPPAAEPGLCTIGFPDVVHVDLGERVLHLSRGVIRVTGDPRLSELERMCALLVIAYFEIIPPGLSWTVN